MPLVNVMVNNKAYTIACDEGEEDHLRDIASKVDAKAREVVGSVGNVGENKLLLMAALLMADEHHDALAKAEQARDAKPSAKANDAAEARVAKAENLAADLLESAAKRIEGITARLAPV